MADLAPEASIFFSRQFPGNFTTESKILQNQRPYNRD